MKKVLALLMFPAFVSAQPSCWPNTNLPISVHRADVSAPKLGDIVYSASSIGLVYGWACAKADGTWQHVVIGGPWSAFRPDWAAIADSLMRGSDADRAAAWKTYITGTTFDSRLQADVDSIRAKLPKPAAAPPLPAPGTWVVAPTSICGTQDKEGGVCVRRQSFSWDGKTRGLVAQPERATIGAQCVTSIGVEPYFGFDANRADRVVLCVRK
jgi:hypothetical protein